MTSPVSLERPIMLCLLLLPTVAVLLSYVRFLHTKDSNKPALSVVRFWVYTALRFLSAVAVVLALAGLSAGESVTQSPKKGVAAAFVLDVSHGMESPFFEDMTCLDAAKALASSLLALLEQSAQQSIEQSIEHSEQSTEQTDAALIACRSTGAALLSPYTCDFEWLCDSILMLTAEGEPLGDAALDQGIRAALTSLPKASSCKPFVLLFTANVQPTEDVRCQLEAAGNAGFATAVILLPADQEEDTDAAKEAWQGAQLVLWAADEGAGGKLVRFLDIGGSGDPLRVASKTQKRSLVHQAALAAAWLFALSVAAESVKVSAAKGAAAFLLCFALSFVSCSGQPANGTARGVADEWLIVRGRSFWQAGQWHQAIACFLETAENAQKRGDGITYSYAQAALGTSYLMLESDQAAFESYQEAWVEATGEVRFLILYNEGVAYYKRGQMSAAADCFKGALLLDERSLEAKINLELCLEEAAKREQQDAQKGAWVSGGEGEFGQLLYSIVRDEERRQCKAGTQKEH